MSDALSGAYLFHPSTEEHTDAKDTDAEVEVFKKKLDDLLKKSHGKIEEATVKALQLRNQLRRRPESVSAMKAVFDTDKVKT